MKPLTQRQATLTALAAQGMGCKEIARELGIAVNTARATLQQARERTDSRNTTHLVAKSLINGWIKVACLALALCLLMGTGDFDKMRRPVARIRVQRSTTHITA